MTIITLMVLPTIPLAFGISSSINVTTFENSTSQIGRPNENQTAAQIKMCPTTTGIAPEESENNSTDIECLQNVFESCQPFDAFLGYVLGSLRVSIKGITNGDCYLNLGHEIERGQTNLSCTIPLDKISTWTNWKRGDGFDAIDQIAKYLYDTPVVLIIHKKLVL